MGICWDVTLVIHKRFARQPDAFWYYQGSLAFIFALGSILFGLIINKYDHKKMLYFALQIFVASLIAILLVTITNSHNPLLITLSLILFCIGQIIPGYILFPLCLNFMPHAKGKISAVLQGFRLIMSSLSLQIAAYYYTGSFRNIGIIISGFVVITIVTLFFVIKNSELMQLEKNPNIS